MTLPTSTFVPSVDDLIPVARQTCHELMAILAEENSGLAKFDVTQVEVRLQHKKRLTLRLEQLLAEIKKSGSLLKADARKQAQILHLAEEVRHFQTLATQNTSMLKAAHQIRADLILSIRDMNEASMPQAQLYNASGYARATSSGARLLAREA